MLQQTQVATVIPYFERFTARFPDVTPLADAHIDDVLECWAGLGYYARARHLHAAACIVRDRYGGELPNNFEAISGLPGIGRSTAGAILALAYNQRYVILDGNVKRVLTRHRLVERWPGAAQVTNQLWQHADRFTPNKRVAQYTQAIMDLGALVCTARNPHCLICPVQDDCAARNTGRQHELPTSKPRKPLPVRETMMVMVRSGGDVLLERRPPAGLWGGLLSFPEVRDEDECLVWCERVLGATPRSITSWSRITHEFTHFRLNITPLEIHAPRRAARLSEHSRWLWYNSTAPRGGLAAPVKQLLQRLLQPHEGATDGPNRTVREAKQRGRGIG